MFNKKIEDDSEHSFWISYADMLTGFLISFMVIALLLANQVNNIEKGKTEQFEEFKKEIKDSTDFQKDMLGWRTITIADSQTIRFCTVDSNSLFESGGDEPTPYFKDVLTRFSPTFNRVMYDLLMTKKYNIKEIRFEGHTDQTAIVNSETSYFDNLHLSARRASNVQRILVTMADTSKFYGRGYSRSYDNDMLIDFKNKLFNLSVSCGYSYAKRLDSTGKQIIPICPENASSNNPCKEPYDEKKSRRIEIRIIGSDKK